MDESAAIPRVMNHTDQLSTITAQLTELLGVHYVTEEYVHFRIAYAGLQISVLQALSTLSVQVLGSGMQWLVLGADAAHPALPHLEPGLTKYANELLELMAARENAPDTWSILLQALETGVTAASCIAAAGWPAHSSTQLPRLARQIGIPEPELSMYAQHLLAPYYAYAAEQQLAEPPQPAHWEPQPGRCPKCQAHPALAVLQLDDGKRMLHCCLCGEQWEFPRFQCPACLAVSPGKLETIFADTSQPYWLEVCRSCQGYIKTVDLRRFPTSVVFCPYVVDTETLFLDLMGEQAGFQGKPVYAPLRASSITIVSGGTTAC